MSERPHDPDPATVTDPATGPDRRPRPVVERLGMAVIAAVMAGLFAVVALAAFAGGEPFLWIMGACGCLMVLWVGGISVLRG
jgi:hypothetical protein